MPFLGSKSNSKRRSHTPNTTSTPSSLLSRLPLNASSPAVYYSQHQNTSNPNLATPHPRVNRSTDYKASSSNSNSSPPPPPYDFRSSSPIPTPSTSWTSEMSVLADKIRDDAVAISANTSSSQQQQQMAPFEMLDRRSISQGMKLVAIAADEYEDGNMTVALDIYLSGIDKILMALPNKTDPKTKFALREKLTSVEERVGILNIASQHRQKRLQQFLEDELLDDPSQHQERKRSIFDSLGLSRISNTIGTITTIATSRVYYNSNNANNNNASDHSSSILQQHANSVASASDPVERFKQFGQFIINTTVTCAILVKQSPLPDIAYFMFGYIVQLLFWVDSQYHIHQKAQNFGVECVKLFLKADEQYRLHEFASEALYMLIAAALKAAVAYKEAPGYRDPVVLQSTLEYVDDDEEEEPPVSMDPSASVEYCSPPSPAKSRIPWIW
ncbi:hypothetical protein BDA99DRAFT_506742 [Phascolomyces articulosus]|uniref:MIT domain-containing protein n=1 Tax=Phascolomyces articulosus TaxID=60185 RepID=A0AAD5PH55_9FUNG|nr:hypothetical protein BDA99DRAFT_506742 [Phascolomyces articulosus]